MTYHVAERFKSIQGEGYFAGTPMAFVRFVGCSVGKRVCHGCDTDFNQILTWRGGGAYTVEELLNWAAPYTRICLTGGEPLDQDLLPLFDANVRGTMRFHLETSGTIATTFDPLHRSHLWICVSPKPGWTESMIEIADEIKIIVPGLGNGAGWPTIENASRWAADGKRVFLQPRNEKLDINHQNLRYVQDIIADHPEFRLSVQLHKILRVQ